MVPVRRYQLSIDPRKLFDAFDAVTAHGTVLWNATELNQKIEQNLDAHLKNSEVRLPDGWEQQVRPLVADIGAAFFEMNRPVDGRPGTFPCGSLDSRVACAKLNFRWREGHDLNLERKWEQRAFIATDKKWTTTTPYHR